MRKILLAIAALVLPALAGAGPFSGGSGGGGGGSGATGATGPAGASAYTVIASSTIGAVGSITITGIDQSYDEIIVELLLRSDSVTLYEVKLTFNGDTTEGNYQSEKRYLGTRSLDGSRNIGIASTISTAAAQWRTRTRITIPDYTSTTFVKSCIVRGDANFDPAGANGSYNLSGVFTWMPTAAIETIKAELTGGNFAAGSSMRIIGINY